MGRKKKVVEDVSRNFPKFRSMGFQGGVESLQRMVQTIFAIRLKDYVVQGINIIGNILKIASVFYFFNFQHYYLTFTDQCIKLFLVVNY